MRITVTLDLVLVVVKIIRQALKWDDDLKKLMQKLISLFHLEWEKEKKKESNDIYISSNNACI